MSEVMTEEDRRAAIKTDMAASNREAIRGKCALKFAHLEEREAVAPPVAEELPEVEPVVEVESEPAPE